MSTTPTTVYLKDYQELPYLIPRVHLHFSVYETYIDVTSTFTIKQKTNTPAPLVLYGGKELELSSVLINDKETSNYQKDLETLTLQVNANDVLTLKTRIYPHQNLSLEGIYASGSILCSQNEPEGFRHITYFLDRPDNLSIFTTVIEADSTQYPHLLSNGNLVETKTISNTRTQVTWHDPFPKPTYLFAFVAGHFGYVEDQYETKSGKSVLIQFYVDQGNEYKCGHAIESLKRSMKWDEDVYNFEYDLDRYMVVAVDAFNFGAMENKGLNIFNSKYVLADPKTATDQDYINIETVIAHEYFHNWTGNRITCRDWFQLTLKEGLTVFRDQHYTGDVTSPTVNRIQEVRSLKTVQFLEDSGPNAHPIRPESYSEINNFYTATVYRKGAEVIRMIHTILGHETYMKGIDIYKERFDGKAVTTDDFIDAMKQASGFNFDVFKQWYRQAGTPELHIEMTPNNDTKTCVVTLKQTCTSTPESQSKQPFCIPLTYNVISNEGVSKSNTFLLEKKEESFVIPWTDSSVPVWLHDFSAPVHLYTNYSPADYITIVKKSTNLFTRTEAMQALLVHCIENELKTNAPLSQEMCDSFSLVWLDNSITDYEKAEFLSIPSTAYLAAHLHEYDFVRLAEARKNVVKKLASVFQKDLYDYIRNCNVLETPFSLSIENIGKRQLHNACLHLLGYLSCEYTSLAFDIFKKSTTMTIQIAALQALSRQPSDEYTTALALFYDQWKHEFLVMTKWFMIQALQPHGNVLEIINQLEKNPVFKSKNPNMMRALYGAFTMNLSSFHTKEGYAFIKDKIIEIDQFNPSMASSLMESFSYYKKLPQKTKQIMESCLNDLTKEKDLSKNTTEILSNIIGK